MARRKNEVKDFAIWFANHIGIEVNFSSGEFKKILGQTSRLRKEGYDLRIARAVISAMKVRGIEVRTPYCITWQSPDRKTTWYEFSRPHQPPVWDGLGMHLLEADDLPARFN
jgi:hypothetical protein